jgi:hypothetical protein
VAIVNNTLAQRFFGGAANAISRRVRVGDGDWRTIVGVAADVKYARINEAPRPYVYLPALQLYRPTMVLHTRGSAPLPALLEQARAIVTGVDPDLPIVYARSLAEETSAGLIIFRFLAAGLLLFGVAGMALAAMGIYGLVSYTVKQSTREIGIRLALGATGRAVVGAFAGRGLRLGIVGAAIGIVVALAISRLLSSVLFGVSATDLFSFTRALAVVLGTVVIATLIPAWRAIRTNPVTALRHQ